MELVRPWTFWKTKVARAEFDVAVRLWDELQREKDEMGNRRDSGDVLEKVSRIKGAQSIPTSNAHQRNETST